MKVLTAFAVRIFPGLSYWMRLPGITAFCGTAAGICAARLFLAAADAPSAPSDISIYIRLLAGVTFFSAAVGIMCGRPILRTAFFAVCGAALFTGSELGLRDFYGRMEAAGERNQILTLTVRITSPVVSAHSSYRFRASVIDTDNAEVARILLGKTLQCVSRRPVPPYGAVTIQGGYSAPRPAAGPLGFDQREHFAVNNVYGSFAVSRILSDDAKKFSHDNLAYILRTRVHSIINKSSSPDARGIFHAAFLGEKEHLSADLNVLFRRSGIVHLLAISGFHAALLYSAIFAALGLFAIPAKARTLLSLAMLWGYLFFIGFIPSLFRATVMVSFFCLSMMLQRKNHALHSLGMAGVLWLCISPRSLFAPGFQLSFAATAGIIMIPRALNMLTDMITSSIRSKPTAFIAGRILSPFWVSVAGFASTAPPLLHHFGTLSLYGIFFNVAAIPLMSAAMWLFFAAVVLSPIDAVSGAAVWCAEKVLDLLVYLAGFSGHLAFSEVIVPRTTALQLAVMTMFMAGLCAVRKDLRAVYALRAGAAASLIIAVSVLYMAMTVKTETFEFTRNASAAHVVIRKDNTAWIAAQGRAFDVRQLREREIEPLLVRKKVRGVPLFIAGEEAEDEAHMFTFATDHDPRVAVIRKDRPRDGGRPPDEGYTRMDARQFADTDGQCILRIDDRGAAAVEIK